MADKIVEAPNMTATEIANAEHPAFPVHGIIGDMVDREIALLDEIASEHGLGADWLKGIELRPMRLKPGALLQIEMPDGD